MLVPEAATAGHTEVRFAGVRFTPLTIDETVGAIAARDPAAPFNAVVTPNAEHVYLARKVTELAELTEAAYISTNDSRILHRAAKFAGLELKLSPGSDVTPLLFERVIRPDDPLTVLGSTPELVAELCAKYGLSRVVQHVPPMGFIHDPQAVQAAVDFAAANPARFVFVAMGPPQSEQLCNRIRLDGRSTGLGLCIGSSLAQITGHLEPAPQWMAKAGIIWLHRLAKEPRRLWRRYLVNDMIALGWCIRDIVAIRLGLKRVD